MMTKFAILFKGKLRVGYSNDFYSRYYQLAFHICIKRENGSSEPAQELEPVPTDAH
jgi:hypothetical protein